jgi:hypothetical protein
MRDADASHLGYKSDPGYRMTLACDAKKKPTKASEGILCDHFSAINMNLPLFADAGSMARLPHLLTGSVHFNLHLGKCHSRYETI